MTEILKVIGLGKEFSGEEGKTIALEDINLEIREGEILCIIGPSGCGKTTLIRCIAGLDHPTTGNIFLNGSEIKRPGPDRIMVFQGLDQLFPWKTVRGNIEYPLAINKRYLGKAKIKEIAEQFIEMVDLKGYENFYPHQLSGGMKQRVAIARSLALQPKLLIMDEPFGSLDAQTRTMLQNELLKIWDKLHPTIIFITHNIQEAIILGHRIMVMDTKPGRVKKVINNYLEKPRYPGMQDFPRLWDEVNSYLQRKIG